jgi:hypothetical protein
MSKCFVIQPFDGGKFDKRFDDIYEPAIKAAGIEPYRVDRDPSVTIPIVSIEREIKNARICFADITLDKPNVWYELGFAFASGKPVVMACSTERQSEKFPFDVQHKNILRYTNESPSDFTALAAEITKRLKAQLESTELVDAFAQQELTAPISGLSLAEITVLAVVGGNPWHTPTMHSTRDDAERAGLTALGFNVAVRRLSQKRFLSVTEEWDEDRDQQYRVVKLTDWIDANEKEFLLHKPLRKPADDVPF